MSILVKDQKKKFNVTVQDSKVYPYLNNKLLKIEVRYDDYCENGHNSFAITGSSYGISGCIHDLIAEQKPELKKYMKWHLTSSDGPIHYVANSMYHAKEVKKNSVVRSYDERLHFNEMPFTFDLSKRLKAFLDTSDLTDIKVTPIKYSGRDDYDFKDNYTFNGITNDWYKSLFSTEREAIEMSQALMNYDYTIVQTISRYEDEKKPDLSAARNAAVWPEAELSDFTEDKLNARLSDLLKEFKSDIEELGMVY